MDVDSIKSWVAETRYAIREKGIWGLDSVWRPPYYKLLHQVERFQDPGVSIYDLEWDVLVILDACRYDLICEVVDDYNFLSTPERIRSLDSMTPGWMERTFIEGRAEEMAKTHYLCANPFSGQKLEASDFAELDEIWRYAWDHEVDTVRPAIVTDRCINYARRVEYDRLLVHYVQPHWPFVPAMHLTNDSGMSLDEFGNYNKNEVWERLRRGEVSRKEVWEGYKKNLEYALDSVAVLLENLDADSIIITSDHGNAFGEWGVYGHPIHMPLSSLRNVPLVKTSAEDKRTRGPDRINREEAAIEVEEQLSALGYS